MNTLVGLCVLVGTAVSVIVHREEIGKAARSLAARFPQAPAPVASVVNLHVDGRVLREVMDITRPPGAEA